MEAENPLLFCVCFNHHLDLFSNFIHNLNRSYTVRVRKEFTFLFT